MKKHYICDDFDEDCLDMTTKQAEGCFKGCAGGLDPCEGYCPIYGDTRKKPDNTGKNFDMVIIDDPVDIDKPRTMPGEKTSKTWKEKTGDEVINDLNNFISEMLNQSKIPKIPVCPHKKMMGVDYKDCNDKKSCPFVTDCYKEWGIRKIDIDAKSTKNINDIIQVEIKIRENKTDKLSDFIKNLNNHDEPRKCLACGKITMKQGFECPHCGGYLSDYDEDD